ncbi:putative iron-siderophore ABC transporter permease protein [Kineosphaera limosa NBRC 100340]|uniref:Putative iron-siderophore ABC transporter permease protein n=1 Tax=Kineosphaera limosa NBRC 100340 TaxID=1184609 RepID=K6X7E5_9MICO|nr:iron chelate uptake ABC transporter family permease subunit [Kineosphaera limosa]GAB94729.1 putative iron-siderophore ABC transporter permease protein [Kineosphaera limosa NBRC 100340]
MSPPDLRPSAARPGPSGHSQDAENPSDPSAGVHPDFRDPRDRRARLVLLVLVAALVAACLAYVFVDLGPARAYVLPRRMQTVATLGLVAAAIGVATVLFHTITDNHILTPSVMGLDSLYLLIQTVAFYVLGPAGVMATPPAVQFLTALGLMTGLAYTLYRRLLIGLGHDLHLLALVGIVLGVLMRSLTNFFTRVMDPTVFVVLQDRMFADFTGAPPITLAMSALVVATVVPAIAAMHRRLDVMALGRDTAVGLGVDHRRTLLRVLLVVVLLVAVSTALVGPTMFFGLIAAHLGYQAVGSYRHRFALPAAALVGALVLVGGQTALDRLLHLDLNLAIIVEFVGGLLFITLLLRRSTP